MRALGHVTVLGFFASARGVFSFFTAFFIAGQLLADTVLLKTGEVFGGRVLRADRDEVSIQLESGGILTFRANRVDRVKKEKSSGEGGSEEIVYGADEASAVGSPLPPPGSPLPPVERASAEETRVVVQPAQGEGRLPPDLSSFPLRARKSSDSSPHDLAPESQGQASGAESGRFWDAHNGYSLVLPVGFKPWADHRMAGVIHAFTDPTTQANLTISVQSSKESIDRVKDTIVSKLSRSSNVKMVRQTSKKVAGPGGNQGWVLEMENRIAEAKVRQLQLLVKIGTKVFIVTYSVADDNFGLLSTCFEQSIGSFRIQSPTKAPKELPAEVRDHLKKPLPRPPSASSAQEHVPEPGRPDVNRLMDRIDNRLKGAPLQPYTIKP